MKIMQWMQENMRLTSLWKTKIFLLTTLNLHVRHHYSKSNMNLKPKRSVPCHQYNLQNTDQLLLSHPCTLDQVACERWEISRSVSRSLK